MAARSVRFAPELPPSLAGVDSAVRRYCQHSTRRQDPPFNPADLSPPLDGLTREPLLTSQISHERHGDGVAASTRPVQQFFA
jgi:hypothetical protein